MDHGNCFSAGLSRLPDYQSSGPDLANLDTEEEDEEAGHWSQETLAPAGHCGHRSHLKQDEVSSDSMTKKMC